jgi:hypothetical protein
MPALPTGDQYGLGGYFVVVLALRSIVAISDCLRRFAGG